MGESSHRVRDGRGDEARRAADDADAAQAPAPAVAAAARLLAARRAGLLCALALAAMSACMLLTISRKSLTVDEVVMIPSGYYHVASGDSRIIHEHPPLSKALAALPLYLSGLVRAYSPKTETAPLTPDVKAKYIARFWEDNAARYRVMAYRARLPAIALTVGLGVLVFVFARTLFGDLAAALAVMLFAAEPTLLAHGRVVQTDVPAAFGLLLTVYALRRYAHAPTLRGAVVVGLACGVAVLAKFSMVVLAPVSAIAFAALAWRAPRDGRRRTRFFGHALLAAAALLLCVQAAYFFHGRALDSEDLRWVGEAFPANAEAMTRLVRALSYLLPTDFVLGLLYQFWHTNVGRAASLLGMHGTHGWWYYFPVAFALKTTLPFLLLSLAALAWGAHQLITRRDTRFVPLLLPFALYTLYLMLSPINTGVRYYLPAYPFLFVACGALLARLLGARREGWRRHAALALVLVSLCWTAAEAVRAYPDHMTYMNQLASARPRWWYLSDSNVEWGDDARELALYLRERGETRVRGSFFTGWFTLRHYGVAYYDLSAPAAARLPPTRYTAVGASFLNGSTVPGRVADGAPLSEQERVNTFAAYRDRAPEKVFGGSIYLFREEE